MSYAHLLCNRGAVHAQDNDYDSEYTVCGKEITYRYDEVSDPITCKVCARSIELSRDHKLARELSALVRELHADMVDRPGAYVHADSQTICRMKEIAEGE